MANVKNAILKKKIGDVLYELMVKTTAEMVQIDDTTTLAAKLVTMLADIEDSKTKLATLLGEDAAQSITGQIEAAVKDAVDAINNEEDETSLAGKVKAINEQITAMQDESTGILATAKAYTDDKIGLSGTAYNTVKEYVDAVKGEINASVAGSFHFKGTVDYVDLLVTEGANEGDVYQVKYAGTSTDAGTEPLNAEYAFNGTEYVELGSVLDLSAYSTTEQTTAAINTAKTEAIEAAAADATSKANTAKTEAVAAAAADATTKADAAKAAAIEAAATDATTKADAAKAAAIEAAAADATTKANAAEENANNYTDAEIVKVNATVETKARFLVGEEVPEDLTEADIFAQIVS